MRSTVYWIDGPWPGRLAIVARPRGGDWLEDEVKGWREARLGTVVSLLTDAETTELGLEKEEQWARTRGLDFHTFPIPDRGVPHSRAELLALLAEVEEHLVSGENVAIHCRQGIGRSALVAAALLVTTGDTPEAAFRKIGEARGCPVPETEQQLEWVRDFSHQSVPTARW